MRNKVVITSGVYMNGQDRIVETIYNADGWTLTSEEKDNYPLLNIWEDGKLIATHRTWDRVRFADDDPIEKVVIIS